MSKATIRPEFRKLLLDQRGAAVILWSCFTIAIAIYIVIAKTILANPKYGAGLTFAESARIVLWALVLVDLGYFVWWKKRNLTTNAILDRTKQAKLLRVLEEYQGGVEQRAASVVSTYVTRKVTLFAIIEALAVYGLVLALVGRYFSDQYLLSGLSLLLFVLEFPKAKSLDSLIRQVEISDQPQQRSTRESSPSDRS
jgi:hypothetical protein